MDRNLLERTCDVRWWALETAFSGCIEQCERVQTALNDLPDSVKEAKHVAAKVVSALIKLGSGSLAQIARREEFIKSLDLLAEAGHLGKQSLNDIKELINDMVKRIDFACDRLEDINNSYTLYRDLVITDRRGVIVANANQQERERVLGLGVAEESWFEQAMATKDGTEYIAQDLCESKVESQPSLIYSTAVRENSETNGSIIGAMGVYFDFQGEARMILDDSLPQSDGELVDDGWYAYFTNEEHHYREF